MRYEAKWLSSYCTTFSRGSYACTPRPPQLIYLVIEAFVLSYQSLFPTSSPSCSSPFSLNLSLPSPHFFLIHSFLPPLLPFPLPAPHLFPSKFFSQPQPPFSPLLPPFLSLHPFLPQPIVLFSSFPLINSLLSFLCLLLPIPLPLPSSHPSFQSAELTPAASSMHKDCSVSYGSRKILSVFACLIICLSVKYIASVLCTSVFVVVFWLCVLFGIFVLRNASLCIFFLFSLEVDILASP